MDDIQNQFLHINDDKRGTIIGSIVLCAVLSYAFVLLKFAVQWRTGTAFRVHDWILVVALLIATGQYVDFAVGTTWDLGRHMVLLTDYADAGKNLLSSGALYVWSIAAVKIYFLALLHHIFRGKRLYIAIWATGILVVLISLAGMLVILLQCIPVEHLWNPSIPGHCYDINMPATLFGSLNILTDVMIILLPIRSIWQLQLQRQEKLQLVGLFMSGGLVTVISAFRLYYTMQIDRYDMTWTYTDAGIWSSAEIACAIVSACLPALRPLFSLRRSKNYSTQRPSIQQLTGGRIVRTVIINVDGGDDNVPLAGHNSGEDVLKMAASSEVYPLAHFGRANTPEAVDSVH